MNKKFITRNADGTISITHIGSNDVEDDDPGGLIMTKTLFELSRTTDIQTHFNPEVHTREVIASGIEGHRALSIIGECESEELPTDRHFRNAWEWSDPSKVHVDLASARTLHMNNIRVVRNKELVKKDAEYMKALEAGNTSAQSTIATEKQTLRDIPQTFDITTGIDTPEKLKARWPDGLPTE